VNYLLDTNVISEPTHKRPDTGLLAWLAAADEDSLFLSVVTITELRFGIHRLAAGRRRQSLEDWLGKELTPRFGQRILPIDVTIADACGRLLAQSTLLGRPIQPADAFIAATAEVHGMTVVTRNVSHFQNAVKHILTPWT
jgi:predicted nucleic acid-binding protein